MSQKCKVRGCRHKLDPMGMPIEYCDYQQGRCPMQKPPELPLKTQALLIASIVLFVGVIFVFIK